jgi:hypothetical protein
MPLAQRPTLALLAVLALNWAVASSGGMYTHFAILLALVALSLALAAALLPEHTWQVSPRVGNTLVLRALQLLTVLSAFEGVRKQDPAAAFVGLGAVGLVVWSSVRKRPPIAPFLGLLAGAALLLSGRGVLTAEVLYGERTALMLLAACAGFVLSAAWLPGMGAPASQRPRRSFWFLLVLVFVAGGLLRLSAVLASPDPVVDVWVALRDAPRHLLEGHNPYTASYPDPYATERARSFGIEAPPHNAAFPFYPPLPFLVALPFHAAGLDVRLANVLADLLAALVLFAAARQHGGVRVGALVATLYLFLPRVPFLIEHAWYEPMLAALLGGGLLLVERGRWSGYLLLGLGLTGKQFGLPMVLPVAWSQRRHWRGLLLGIGLAALPIVPFLFWDPSEFLDVILFKHLQRPAMLDSITVYTGFHELLGVSLPRPLLLGVALVLIGWLSWKTPAQSAASALWVGTVLLVFCVFHTQGYFNYFYLCEFLLLLGVARLGSGVLAPAGDDPVTASPGRRGSPGLPCPAAAARPGSNGRSRGQAATSSPP